MFLRLVADSFTRRPRHKLLTGAALALGMAVVTAALSVSLDVGDRLSHEFRSLGANLLVTPQADTLPLEIGGVDYRPVNSGAYLPESDLPKIKMVFWHNNIIAFAPILEAPVRIGDVSSSTKFSDPMLFYPTATSVTMMGTWNQHAVRLSDGSSFATGIATSAPWWGIEGRLFSEGANECVVGQKLAHRLGIHVGDRITVETNNPKWMVQLAARPLVTGIVSTGDDADEAVVSSLSDVQRLNRIPGVYRRLYVSALTKPEDDFARRGPATMTPDELERWSCSPYVSSIAYSIKQVLPGTDVRVIRRVAEGEGRILTRVRTLLWLVTFAALLAAALAVGASSAASVIERRTEIGLMKALGAGTATVGFLLAAEQLLIAVAGGGAGYALGIFLARLVGEKIFGAAPQPSLLIMVVIVGLAATVTLAGSALPLRRAARYEPAPILRGE
jgi:putative ABC transport system permease protein